MNVLEKYVWSLYDYACNNAIVSKIGGGSKVRLMVSLLIVFAVLVLISTVIWVFISAVLLIMCLLPLNLNCSGPSIVEIIYLLGSAIGGVLVAIGLVFLNKRAKAMDKSAEASLQENQQTLFSTAIGHLGDKTESVRLGGIYALYELATDDTTKEKYRETVHEILCGHIRSKTNEEEYIKQYVDIGTKSKPSTEIQSLLNILTQKPKCLSFQGLSVDFSGAQLQSADLYGAQLQSAFLLSAQLQSAHLNKAQLQSAILIGAQLQGAYLHDAQLQSAILISAQLQSAILISAQLQSAYLDGAQLHGAKLEGIQLAGATSTDWRAQSHFFKYRMRDRVGKPPELDGVTFDDGIDRKQWKDQTYTKEQAEEWIKEMNKANPKLAEE